MQSITAMAVLFAVLLPALTAREPATPCAPSLVRRQAIFLSSPIFDSLLSGAILAAVGLAWVVLMVRIVGLRSLSKMTSFDFVMTVAMGSLVASASQSTQWSAFLQSLAAMAALFAVQYGAALLRRRSQLAAAAMQNEPVLLMRNGKVIEDALKRTRVSRDDLLAKLRSANVTAFEQVRAAVLETTGDVSVIQGDKLEERLLADVERVGGRAIGDAE